MYVALVAVCRLARYSAIALVASYYGRHVVRILRHPGQYWGWVLLCAAIVLAGVTAGIVLRNRLEGSTGES